MIKKDQVSNLLKEFPAEMDLDLFLEQLVLLKKIDRGIADADEGRIFSVSEVKETIGSWSK